MLLSKGPWEGLRSVDTAGSAADRTPIANTIKIIAIEGGASDVVGFGGLSEMPG